MKISIVTTLYASAPYLERFYQRIAKTVKQITSDYEIIMVNDGSPDNSLAIALALKKNDVNIKIIDLSRNFGHHKAIMAGLANCSGEKVFLIDCDLEEPPELLEKFNLEFEKIKANTDVIYGVQDIRKGRWSERVGGGVFYKLLNNFSNIKFENSPLTVRLMSRRYVDSVLLHSEEELYMAGIFDITGFEQKPIVVDKEKRNTSTYTLKHRFSLMIQGITSFSSFPLKFSFYCGFFMALISFSIGVYLIIRKLIYNDLIDPGWTSLMVSIWFVGGVLLVSLGTIGVYISKIYSEVKRRPNYIIKAVYDNKK